jgi:hypothetical protein
MVKNKSDKPARIKGLFRILMLRRSFTIVYLYGPANRYPTSESGYQR